MWLPDPTYTTAKAFLLDPEFQALVGLVEQVWQEMEVEAEGMMQLPHAAAGHS